MSINSGATLRTAVWSVVARNELDVLPKNGYPLVVAVVAHISSGPRQNEMRLEDSEANARDYVEARCSRPVESDVSVRDAISLPGLLRRSFIV